jgi:hypothetical protein
LKVVYHCYGGAHASTTAAAIHLGIIPGNRLPHFSDFRRVPFFDDTTGIQHGKLIKVGTDRFGNEIFVLGRRSSASLIINLIKEFLKLTGDNPEDYLFVSCVQLFNPLMVTGGFSSRAMGWVGIGRPLVTLGTIVSFPFLATIVARTLKTIASNQVQ